MANDHIDFAIFWFIWMKSKTTHFRYDVLSYIFLNENKNILILNKIAHSFPDLCLKTTNWLSTLTNAGIH